MLLGITESHGLFECNDFLIGGTVEFWIGATTEVVEIIGHHVEGNVLWVSLEKMPKGWHDFSLDIVDTDDNDIDYVFYGTKLV